MQNIQIEITSDEIDKIVDAVTDSITENHLDDFADKVFDSVVEDIKNNIRDYVTEDDFEMGSIITGEIEDLIGQFSPGNHCSLGRSVEEMVKESITYGIENDYDFSSKIDDYIKNMIMNSFNTDQQFAQKFGSFIDNWIWKPSDEKHPEYSIKAILGREDASNIHDLSVPVIPVDASDKLALTKEQIQDIIYLTAVTCSGLIGGVRDVNMFELTSTSKISMPQFIQDFLNK